MKLVIYVCAGVAIVAIGILAGTAIYLQGKVTSLVGQLQTLPAREKRWAKEKEPTEQKSNETQNTNETKP